jgi:hypothetical protein
MADNATQADARFEQKCQRAARFNLEQERDAQRLKDAEADFLEYMQDLERWRRENELAARASVYYR